MGIFGGGFFGQRGSLAWALGGLATLYADLGGATQTYEVGIFFQLDATVDVFRGQAADLLNEQIDYVSATPTSNTWVRCTHVSGDDMTSGSSRGAWHNINVPRNFTMTKVSGGGPDLFDGTFNFELSSDSSGSPVVASKLGVRVNVGEIF